MTTSGRDALTVATHLIDGAVRVVSTLGIWHAATRHTNLADGAIEVTEAGGHVRHASPVDTELVVGTVDIGATTRRRHTGARITELVRITLCIGAALEEDTLVIDAHATQTAVPVLDTLGDRFAEAAFTAKP